MEEGHLKTKWSAVVKGVWRYELRREWDKKARPLMFCGLNAATADAKRNDMTITILTRRAQLEHYGSLVVFNLYAFRATQPSDMLAAKDPVGPLNNMYTIKLLKECRSRKGTLLCGWGNHAQKDRVAQLVRWADYHFVKLWCLGTTTRNQPKHPLRISYATEMREWDVQ